MIGFVIDTSHDPIFLGSFLLLVGAAVALAVTIAMRSRRRTTSCTVPLGIALSCSLAAVLVLTLTPAGGANEHQLMPVVHIIHGHPREYRVDVWSNVVANALMFVPLGAALSLLDFRFRTTFLLALALSALIEITQLFIPGRTTSTDDFLLNTFGALLGYALVRTWRRVPVPEATGTTHARQDL